MRDSGCEMWDVRFGKRYRGLDIWKLARQATIAVHPMTLQGLPKFEMHEEATEMLFETGSLTNEIAYRDLSAQLDLLGRKINVFIESVERSHRTQRSEIPNLGSRIPHLAS